MDSSPVLIPIGKLMDGSLLCIKNASRLACDAEMLFKSKQYSSCILLAVLALEELGKGYMLMSYYGKKQDITSDIWNKDFKSHKKKLESIGEAFKKSSNNDPAKKEAFERLSGFLLRMSKIKLESLYVDWDKGQKQWRYFDDHEADKRKLAQEAIKSNKMLIVSFIENMGDDDDLKLISIGKKRRLLAKGKICGMCDICGLVMLTAAECKQHVARSGHRFGDISWHHT